MTGSEQTVAQLKQTPIVPSGDFFRLMVPGRRSRILLTQESIWIAKLLKLHRLNTLDTEATRYIHKKHHILQILQKEVRDIAIQSLDDMRDVLDFCACLVCKTQAL